MRSGGFVKPAAAASAGGTLLAGGSILAFALPGLLGDTLGWFLALAAGGASLVAVAAWVVVLRDRAEQRGADLFLRFNASRYEPALEAKSRGPLLRGIRSSLTGQRFLVGDWVRVRSLDAIRATLDVDGALEGLPFMAEMERHAGSRAQVFRVVDKVYDYGGSKKLRQMRGETLLLRGLRCDGSAHGGCQAACYLMWKAEWLEPASTTDCPEATRGTVDTRSIVRGDPAGSEERHLCQYTQVVAASESRQPRGPSADLVPLLVGNVAPGAFALGMLTRFFNRVQSWRGGGGYPAFPGVRSSGRGVGRLGLVAGDRVRVRDKRSIAATLDARGFDRGLWFDVDMLRHCGRIYKVETRVERIIDDASGRMITMKTPCVILEGVYTSGEILRFWPQHDYSFWREAWLERVEGGEGPGAGPDSRRAAGPPAAPRLQ